MPSAHLPKRDLVEHIAMRGGAGAGAPFSPKKKLYRGIVTDIADPVYRALLWEGFVVVLTATLHPGRKLRFPAKLMQVHAAAITKMRGL